MAIQSLVRSTIIEKILNDKDLTKHGDHYHASFGETPPENSMIQIFGSTATAGFSQPVVCLIIDDFG